MLPLLQSWVCLYVCLHVRVCETGDWDLFLDPVSLEWATVETGHGELNDGCYSEGDSWSRVRVGQNVER